MAVLRDLLVQGPARFLHDIWGSTFHGDVDGTSSYATNLTAAPVLAASGNNITVTAGGKTSSAFTVPFATSASSAGSAGTATKAGVSTIWMYPENGNEINFGGTNSGSILYFGYRTKDSRPIPTEFRFGGSGTASLIAGKFVKSGGTAAQFLKADGTVDSTSYAALASPAFTGTPTAPTANAGTNTTQIATTAFVKAEINSVLAASDAMVYKGTLGTGGTITSLPATHSVGDTYKVITAGTYAGVKCEIGDMIICITNGTAAADAHWTVVQSNLDGAVTGPTASVTNRVAIFDGTTGKVIKDSGFTISASVPSGAKFTDTTYSVLTAASGGTSASLVTTGDKWNWDNKYVAKTDGVTNVTYTGSTIKKTINGTASNVVTAATIVSDGGAVKLDPGTNEQTIKSKISTMSEGVIDLWRNSGDHYTFLGFSNGTTKKYLGGIGFKSKSDHELYLKQADATNTPASSTNYYKIWHEGNDGSGSGLDADTVDGKEASAFELSSNKVTSISSASTDTQYPSAKLVYDTFNNNTVIKKTLTTCNNYIDFAVLLCKVDNTSIYADLYCGGTLYLKRANILQNLICKIDFFVGKDYNSTNPIFCGMQSSGGEYTPELITCTYNSIPYVALYIKVSASCWHTAIFEGISNNIDSMQIVGVYKHEGSTPQVLNQEIYDSKTTITTTEHPIVFYNAPKLTLDHGVTTKEFIHESNYTDYTVKKDGTGATGSWNITASNTTKLNGQSASYYASSSHNHDSDYLKLVSGSTPVSFNTNNLPSFSGAPSYLVGIEAFASGGTLKWQNASSCTVGSATRATNLAGGAANKIPYQTAAGTTSFIAAGTSGQVLKAGTNGVPAWGTDNDTKNTAGTTNSASVKLFLVGAKEQSANPQTFTNVNTYINTDNNLYSNGFVGTTYVQAGTYVRAKGNDVYVGASSSAQCHLQYDTTNKCINFVFD